MGQQGGEQSQPGEEIYPVHCERREARGGSTNSFEEQEDGDANFRTETNNDHKTSAIKETTNQYGAATRLLEAFATQDFYIIIELQMRRS